uniref:Uncharacterized protein n=1 Tax=Timema poppense TaxID=170557 RepID=A0A7R9CQH7_TIMPO|nr:unnamed protein product [Timema poppensis]
MINNDCEGLGEGVCETFWTTDTPAERANFSTDASRSRAYGSVSDSNVNFLTRHSKKTRGNTSSGFPRRTYSLQANRYIPRPEIKSELLPGAYAVEVVIKVCESLLQEPPSVGTYAELLDDPWVQNKYGSQLIMDSVNLKTLPI